MTQVIWRLGRGGLGENNLARVHDEEKSEGEGKGESRKSVRGEEQLVPLPPPPIFIKAGVD
ncbi:hypothetical protein E4U23_003771 [Claviceps purpurea]|nr:hypothetical protein E4U51_004084 [Claviceps purpurea]KAG6247465.1 hypothetical protein E4U23_003771 [Claviceps purpurea]